MNERKYSWGPLFETMKELDTDYKDETLRKGFELFKELDAVYTYHTWDPSVAIREALTKAALTPYEQNKLNSPCLDGILLTHKANNPFNEIIINYPKYVDTFLYYIEIFQVTEPTLHLLAFTGRVELFNCLKAEHLAITEIRRIGYDSLHYEYIPIAYIMFEQACRYGHLELAKTIFERQKLDKKYIRCDSICDLAYYPDIVEFLIEKDIKLKERWNFENMETENTAIWALNTACARGQIDIVKRFLTHDKITICNTTLSIAISSGNCELVELLICKDKHVKDNVSYPPFITDSLEMSELLTKYGMKNEYRKKN